MPVNVLMEIHTDGMHTCRHTEMPMHTHTNMKTYTHAYAYTEAHRQTHRHTKTHIQTDTLDTKRHKHADNHTPTDIQIHIHTVLTDTHRWTHTCRLTGRHTYTDSQTSDPRPACVPPRTNKTHNINGLLSQVFSCVARHTNLSTACGQDTQTCLLHVGKGPLLGAQA